MIHSMSNLTSMVILVVILVVLAITVVGSVYLLNRAVKEQYIYNNTALPSLDEEEEEKQKEEEEKQQFENILDSTKSRRADWSDFNATLEDESDEMTTPAEYEEELQPATETTAKHSNSLPDLS